MNIDENSAISPTPPPAWPTLTAGEARVLGALIEKQLTTPEYYPLTLNALIAACNQKNNRDPLMSLDENTVAEALESLRDKKLAWQVSLAGNRVPKYRHSFADVYRVREECVPLLAELLLRGPQTAAELRTRAGRMHAYGDPAAVEAILQGLADHGEGPLAVKLAREAGRREARWAQLLCGPVAASAAASESATAQGSLSAGNRLERLEEEVAALRAQLTALQERFEVFSRQFDAQDAAATSQPGSARGCDPDRG